MEHIVDHEIIKSWDIYKSIIYNKIWSIYRPIFCIKRGPVHKTIDQL